MYVPSNGHVCVNTVISIAFWQKRHEFLSPIFIIKGQKSHNSKFNISRSNNTFIHIKVTSVTKNMSTCLHKSCKKITNLFYCCDLRLWRGAQVRSDNYIMYIHCILYFHYANINITEVYTEQTNRTSSHTEQWSWHWCKMCCDQHVYLAILRLAVLTFKLKVTNWPCQEQQEYKV
jgi:hypothetical protein